MSRGLRAESASGEHAKRYDLGDVPVDMTGFTIFYKAR